MKDKFEISVKKIMTNTYDTLPEKETVWKGIDQKLHRNKVRRLFIRISMAASILIIVGITTLMTTVNRTPKYITDYYCEVSAELSETEFYFANLIEEKKQQIDYEDISSKQLFQPFFNEIEELDNQYEQYKKDIDKYGFQEELIRAIIETQQQKLDVLNRLLLEIQKIKSYENRKKTYQI